MTAIGNAAEYPMKPSWRRLRVSVNRQRFLATEMPDVMKGFCHPLAFLPLSEDRRDIADGVNPPFLRGSVTALSYRGMRFGVCTAHQIHDNQGEDHAMNACFAFKSDDSVKYIGPSRILFFGQSIKSASMVEEADFCLMDFSSTPAKGQKFTKKFLRLYNNSFLEDGDNVIMYLICGHLNEKMQYEPSDDYYYDSASGVLTGKLKIIAKQMQVWGDPVDQETSSFLRRCRQRNDYDYDPDGFSGGPVFAFVNESGRIVTKFAGVTTQADRFKLKDRTIQFIESSRIRQLMDQAVTSSIERGRDVSVDLEVQKGG